MSPDLQHVGEVEHGGDADGELVREVLADWLPVLDQQEPWLLLLLALGLCHKAGINQSGETLTNGSVMV